MDKKIFQITVVIALMLTLLSACTLTGEPDLEATASAMVAATMTAEAARQDEIDAAVAATMTAAPQPTTIEVVDLTEEELAALIDEAVAEAIAASEEAAAKTAAATADATVTEDEAANVTTVVVYAEGSLAYAEELLSYYYSLYEGYADEAITTLNGIEAELAAISTNLQGY